MAIQTYWQRAQRLFHKMQQNRDKPVFHVRLKISLERSCGNREPQPDKRNQSKKSCFVQNFHKHSMDNFDIRLFMRIKVITPGTRIKIIFQYSSSFIPYVRLTPRAQAMKSLILWRSFFPGCISIPVCTSTPYG